MINYQPINTLLQRANKNVDQRFIDGFLEDDRKDARILEDILGKRMTKMLFSDSPKERAEAYQYLIIGIKEFDFTQIGRKKSQETYVALFSVIDKGTFEDDQKVIQSAVDLLVNLIDLHGRQFVGKLEEEEMEDELQDHSMSIIDNLLIKLGNENIRMQQDAFIGLNKLSHFQVTNYKKQIDRIVGGKKTKKKEIIQGKLRHLRQLIDHHKIDNTKYEKPQVITEYILKYVDHGDKDIQEDAYLALLKYYEQVGPKINKHLIRMTPASAQLFSEAQQIHQEEGFAVAKRYIS